MAIKFKQGDRVVYAQQQLLDQSPYYGLKGIIATTPIRNKQSVLVQFDEGPIVVVQATSLELLLEVNNGTQARLQE